MEQKYSPVQKILIYTGILITIVGFITFFALFISDSFFASGSGGEDGKEMDNSTIAFRAILGIVLIIIGGYIYSIGYRGFVMVSDEKQVAEGGEKLLVSYSKQANDYESAPPAGSEESDDWVTCPACDSVNAKSARYCINCNEEL